MRIGRYATSRQKSCQPCSSAKAKCDRQLGSCTRCSQRGLHCNYPQSTPSRSSSHITGSGNGGASSSPLPTSYSLPQQRPDTDRSLIEDQIIGESAGNTDLEVAQPEDDDTPTNPTLLTAGSRYVAAPQLDVTDRLLSGSETFDFTNLNLICPINAEDISNRWLNAFVPGPGQSVKHYPTAVSSFIYRILQSYVSVTVRGRGIPPFVHTSQTTAASMVPQFSTCLTLVRMCEKPLPGSENTAIEILQREMETLYSGHEACDNFSLLATFQSYLIYSMVLFFKLRQDSTSTTFLRQAMMNLQSLASSTSHQGLMCLEEKHRSRPNWESWIVAEAKRRTLYAMYLFDSVLSVQDNLPTYLGIELEGLPAPQSKHLWSACTRREWETAYNTHIVDWGEGGLRIEELWPIPACLDESGVRERRGRIDLWLEDVDEFGTMMYAVTSCTHGG